MCKDNSSLKDMQPPTKECPEHKQQGRGASVKEYSDYKQSLDPNCSENYWLKSVNLQYQYLQGELSETNTHLLHLGKCISHSLNEHIAPTQAAASTPSPIDTNSRFARTHPHIRKMQMENSQNSQQKWRRKRERNYTELRSGCRW